MCLDAAISCLTAVNFADTVASWCDDASAERSIHVSHAKDRFDRAARGNWSLYIVRHYLKSFPANQSRLQKQMLMVDIQCIFNSSSIESCCASLLGPS